MSSLRSDANGRRLGAAIVAVLLGLMLAGCGASQSGSGASPAASSSSGSNGY